MVLSNRCQFLVLTLCCFSVLQACGRAATTPDAATQGTPTVKGEFPFSTVEPRVYSADIVLSDGTFESRWSVARRNDHSRIDFYNGGEAVESKVEAEKQYRIDHARRMYTVFDETPGANPDDDPARSFFRGREFRQFEEVGRSEGRITYRVKPDRSSTGEILISIDEATNMMVRQEFRAGPDDPTVAPLIYELQNFKTEVDEHAFEVPTGYRQVTKQQYETLKASKTK